MRGFIDFWVYCCTLTGYIPAIRSGLFLYRTLYGVKIGKNSSIHWRAEFNQPGGVSIGHNDDYPEMMHFWMDAPEILLHTGKNMVIR